MKQMVLMILCVAWGCFQAKAQNTYIRHQVWLGGFAQIKIKGKWGWWLDG
jgi:hypothetical protein